MLSEWNLVHLECFRGAFVVIVLPSCPGSDTDKHFPREDEKCNLECLNSYLDEVNVIVIVVDAVSGKEGQPRSTFFTFWHIKLWNSFASF